MTEDIIHLIEDIAITSEGKSVITSWCGRVSSTNRVMRLSRKPGKITCDECKEASALQLLADAI